MEPDAAQLMVLDPLLDPTHEDSEVAFVGPQMRRHVEDPKELFVDQLGEALNMERTVLTMLKKNEQTATEPEPRAPR